MTAGADDAPPNSGIEACDNFKVASCCKTSLCSWIKISSAYLALSRSTKCLPWFCKQSSVGKSASHQGRAGECQWTANQRSVTHLRPKDTAEDPFWYTFKVQCTSCREIHANWVGVSRFVRAALLFNTVVQLSQPRLRLIQEVNQMSGSRGEANFVWKCKNCKVGSPP